MSDKLSEQELIQMLNKARAVVTVGAQYRHYKGNMYEVIDVAILTEEIDVGVIYRALYGEKVLFVRPLGVWLEKVEHEGQLVARFERE